LCDNALKMLQGYLSICPMKNQDREETKDVQRIPYFLQILCTLDWNLLLLHSDLPLYFVIIHEMNTYCL
jgi:hypothetical protein